MVKTVAVVNQKGGVGKTTTSISLAAALSILGKKVLLIDLDPQAHSTAGVGIDPEHFEYAIDDVLYRTVTIQDAIKATTIDGLHIVPSRLRLDRAEYQLTAEIYREQLLLDALDGLPYDYTVIDCRPSIGTLTVNAIRAADHIIVPCEVSRYSLEGFSDLMATISRVKGQKRKKEDFVRVILTKYESRNTVSIQWLFNQLAGYEQFLFETRIRKSEAINQSHMIRRPVFMYKPESPGAEDYMRMTKEFLQLWDLAEKE